jgi:predicted Zn finger-like uncharacterized protein
MILTCPQCATRYQADAEKFRPAGRNVRCAKCSHLWHQDPPPDESDPLADLVAPEPAEPETAPPPPPPPPPPPVMRSTPPQALAPNPVIAREARHAEPAAQPRRPMRIGLVIGWIALIAVVLAIGWAALKFRQQVATIWPQSASVYHALGMKTHPRGLDIQAYSTSRTTEGGAAVLVVSGLIVNTAAHELPVPEIRAALTDDEHREIYQWKFMPGAVTLKPGQSAQFHSRLNDPPDGSHVELRFVKEGE